MFQRALAGALDSGPISHRIGKGNPKLQNVCAAIYHRPHDRYRHGGRWISRGDKRNQRFFLLRLQPSECFRDTGHCWDDSVSRKMNQNSLESHSSREFLDRVQSCMPARSATVFMSLSPRPDKFTSNTLSFDSEGASFIAWATACADSSAGMMPSMRVSAWKAARASSSVMETYSARPESLSQACSGPTPG